MHLKNTITIYTALVCQKLNDFHQTTLSKWLDPNQVLETQRQLAIQSSDSWLCIHKVAHK